ncbi:hypothetical protein ES703_91686 [subsurface metagenome]
MAEKEGCNCEVVSFELQAGIADNCRKNEYKNTACGEGYPKGKPGL